MIKVNFKEPQIIVYPDDYSSYPVMVMFVHCAKIGCASNTYDWKPVIYGGELALCADMLSNIKSIEHVKPTDL